MCRPFNEMIPTEKLLLYFYSIFSEHGIAVTLTTNEGDRIFDTMKHILKMSMVGDTLRLKSSSLGGGQQMAQDYGREIAKKLAG